MKVKFEMFKSRVETWAALFEEASEYANKLGPDKLINISHSCDGGAAVVTVWYWGKR